MQKFKIVVYFKEQQLKIKKKNFFFFFLPYEGFCIFSTDFKGLKNIVSEIYQEVKI